ncbi:hypothetical protein A5648_02465 [Mycolicibacter sinensis]|uniref:Uncharacterized protein n=1 Tax=Mycolicibacter sinensis (strain JDM601) TaxID=875328 RepID=A0A1A3TYD3_MYCSD|nr:hypothetical protein A5648_02465 [Mycolicibacter sinensis]
MVEDTNVDDPITSREALQQFCRYAFELCDWLQAADIDQSSKDAVRQLFGQRSKNPAQRKPGTSIALAACADLANESKHAVLDRSSYSEGGHANVTHECMSSVDDLPEFARRLVDDVPRIGEHQWMWIITINGKEYDALVLAEDAMNDWTNCLVDAGLVASHVNGWAFL